MCRVLSTNKHNDTKCIIYSNERTDQIHFWYFTLCYASKLRLPRHTHQLRHGMAWASHDTPRLSSKCCSLLLQFSPFQFNWMRWIEFGYIYIFTIAHISAASIHSTVQHNTTQLALSLSPLIHVFPSRLIKVFHTICPAYTVFNLVLCDAPNFVCNSIYRMNWIGILYTHTRRLIIESTCSTQPYIVLHSFNDYWGNSARIFRFTRKLNAINYMKEKIGKSTAAAAATTNCQNLLCSLAQNGIARSPQSPKSSPPSFPPFIVYLCTQELYSLYEKCKYKCWQFEWNANFPLQF